MFQFKLQELRAIRVNKRVSWRALEVVAIWAKPVRKDQFLSWMWKAPPLSLVVNPSSFFLCSLNSLSVMDRQPVYSLSVLAPDQDANEESRSQIQSQLRDFILEFRLDNAFIYRYDDE